MIELIYPIDIAPMIPAPTSESARNHPKSSEIFPVVEPNGIVTGRATRQYCHSGAKPLHPVVHLHIIDRYGRIYLQKRSMNKDIQPGKWDTAVGGHISYGEEILEALYRESSEELRFSDYNPIYIKSYVFESQVEKELVNIFAAVGSFELTPDEDEVEQGRWWPFDEVEQAYGKEILTPNFESEFKDIRRMLEALL